MQQDLAEIQVEQPERKMTIKNAELENLDGFRLQIYMSKLDMHSVSLKVRDIQVWQPSMAQALVPVR